MKEQEENIDKLFKEKLGERSFEIPAGYVSNLESMLPPERSNVKLFWVLGLFFYALGILAGIYFWPNNDSIQQYHESNQFAIVDSVKLHRQEGFEGEKPITFEDDVANANNIGNTDLPAVNTPTSNSQTAEDNYNSRVDSKPKGSANSKNIKDNFVKNTASSNTSATSTSKDFKQTESNVTTDASASKR